MVKLVTTFALVIASFVAAAQTPLEKGMGSALKLWDEGKNTEAIAQFERIASLEKTNWLPNYYIAAINTFEAFKEQDKTKVKTLLEAAQKAQDEINILAPDNAEVLVMQAMIHTAWIVYDPMTNGQRLYQDVLFLYGKAEKIAPENPRVAFNKADFEKGGAAYFGGDTAPMCEKIKASINLFANFKPETPYHPTWGLARAIQEAESCK
jgi:hypothetical protein